MLSSVEFPETLFSKGMAWFDHPLFLRGRYGQRQRLDKNKDFEAPAVPGQADWDKYF